MSCGTPTVTTNVVGLADLPTYQCDPDPEDLAKAISYAIDHKEVLADTQSKVTRRDLNLENWEQAWLKVIKSISQ